MSKDTEQALWENQLNTLFKQKGKYLEGYDMQWEAQCGKD